jgi:pimeloyl-ACP methyl ester carboxylesterase
MDALRAALGDDKLTYLGFSYGTSIGSRYAARFPTHIRAMALDGDIDPSLSLMDLTTQQADSLERNYQEFIRLCKAATTCPLGADPDAAITTVLAGLDAHPVTLADGRRVGRGEALTALLASMYSASAWDQVYAVFAAAVQGSFAELQTLADSYTGRSATGFNHQMEANAAVNCADYVMPTDIAAYDAVAQATQARDPHFGAAAVYGGLTCAYWPLHGPPARALSVHGAPTILLVGGTHDPATPYAWSQALQKQIAGSVLITRNGFGHVSYLPSRCISTKVDAYLIGLTVPADGTTCAS